MPLASTGGGRSLGLGLRAETVRAEESGQGRLFLVKDQLPKPPKSATRLSQTFHLEVLGYCRNDFTLDYTARLLGQLMREIRASC